MSDLLDVLEAIESVAGDDWCEDLAMSHKLTGRIAVAREKLSAIYQLAHAFNTRHSCHHVHDNWREGLKKFDELRGGSGSE